MNASTPSRLSTGLPALDGLLGGGLLPGSLTVVVGATVVGGFAFYGRRPKDNSGEKQTAEG